MKIKFKLEKETPGTYRYQEIDDSGNKAANPSIPTIYIQKTAFAGKAPEFITAVFEYE